jgi:hypothetical protein
MGGPEFKPQNCQYLLNSDPIILSINIESKCSGVKTVYQNAQYFKMAVKTSDMPPGVLTSVPFPAGCTRIFYKLSEAFLSNASWYRGFWKAGPETALS